MGGIKGRSYCLSRVGRKSPFTMSAATHVRDNRHKRSRSRQAKHLEKKTVGTCVRLANDAASLICVSQKSKVSHKCSPRPRAEDTLLALELFQSLRLEYVTNQLSSNQIPKVQTAFYRVTASRAKWTKVRQKRSLLPLVPTCRHRPYQRRSTDILSLQRDS